MIHRLALLTQYRYARELLRQGHVALAYVARDIANIANEIMREMRK